jgi:hypothetical protein
MGGNGQGSILSPTASDVDVRKSINSPFDQRQTMASIETVETVLTTGGRDSLWTTKSPSNNSGADYATQVDTPSSQNTQEHSTSPKPIVYRDTRGFFNVVNLVDQ